MPGCRFIYVLLTLRCLDRLSLRRTSPPAHEATSTGPPCAELALLLTRRPRQTLQCAELALLLTRRPRQALPCAEQALLLTRRPRQAIPCARKSLLLTRPMNMTAGAPEGRFHARKTILREGNQLVAELDFPVAEFVEALVTSTGSVPYMT